MLCQSLFSCAGAMLLLVLTVSAIPALAAWPLDGVPLCTATSEQDIPQIVTDGAGGAIITWRDRRAGFDNADIYALHVTASGVADPTWPVNGVALCTAYEK